MVGVGRESEGGLARESEGGLASGSLSTRGRRKRRQGLLREVLLGRLRLEEFRRFLVVGDDAERLL